MRRIFFGTGTLVLGLATLMWTAAPSSAGEGRGGGHASGGHAAPAHVGSVHYATRPAPARVAPVRVAPVRVAPVRVAPARVTAPGARTGSVRSEHYAGSRIGWRLPQSLPGRLFQALPSWATSPSCSRTATSITGITTCRSATNRSCEDGITYYLFDGIYYQAYIIGGQTVYVVVPDQ